MSEKIHTHTTSITTCNAHKNKNHKIGNIPLSQQRKLREEEVVVVAITKYSSY